MLFGTVLLSVLALAPCAVLSVPTNSSSTQDCAEKAIAPAWYDTIVTKYFSFWDGDVDLAEEVFSPSLTVWQDRLPAANGSAPYPIFDTEAYLAWWRVSREGWEPYQFINRYHFGYDNRVVVRWTLDAVLQDPALSFPGVTIPAGTHVGYNGTDVLTLNRCTGKIDMIESAQDLITYFHELGLRSINV